MKTGTDQAALSKDGSHRREIHFSYIPEESKVIYQSKDGREEKVFDALEWLAAMLGGGTSLNSQISSTEEKLIELLKDLP
jgi:hypothetical protein